VIWLLSIPFPDLPHFTSPEIKPFDKWVALNFVMCALFIAAIWIAFGPKALASSCSASSSQLACIPSARDGSREHYLTMTKNRKPSVTMEVLNTVAFNVGYHNEPS